MGNKLTQIAARYTARSDNPRTICSRCEYFEDPSACKKVTGIISPGGWCKLFSAKAKGVLGSRYGK